MRRTVSLCVWVLLVAGCTDPGSLADGGGPEFPATALLTLAGDTGALSVAVRTSPQPPIRGVNQIQLTVTAADGGAPVDGLTVTVDPWMPIMGHGSATTPTVTPQGSGVYDVTDVYMAMPGTWELRTSFSGPATDNVTAQFQIP
ncbi:MAG: FixH family protein [Deltaproteobacteria bacterium]|nr:FixH family protein [Deltaproteobacteria bacterium]